MPPNDFGVFTGPLPLPPVEWDMDIEETEVPAACPVGTSTNFDEVKGSKRDTESLGPPTRPPPLAMSVVAEKGVGLEN